MASMLVVCLRACVTVCICGYARAVEVVRRVGVGRCGVIFSHEVPGTTGAGLRFVTIMTCVQRVGGCTRVRASGLGGALNRHQQ